MVQHFEGFVRMLHIYIIEYALLFSFAFYYHCIHVKTTMSRMLEIKLLLLYINTHTHIYTMMVVNIIKHITVIWLTLRWYMILNIFNY